MTTLSSPVAKHIWLAVVIASACGGVAVIDGDDEGGGGTGGTTTSSTTTTTTTTTTSNTTTTTSSTTTTTSSTGGAPPIPPLVQMDMGTVTPGTPMSLMVPPNALGLIAFLRAQTPDDPAIIDSVVAPDQVALVAGGALPGTLLGYAGQDIMTVAVPMTDEPQAMPFLTGTWTVTPGGGPPPMSGSYEAELWYRQTLDGAFHGGAVDVNVFRVGNVASDGYMDQVVSGALQGFAGLSLGTVNHFILDSDFAFINDANWLDLYLETEGAPGKPALNLMVVAGIDFGDLQPLGYAPSIPGNPLVHGSYHSAVVMLTTGDPTFDAGVLRHEVGHFAGLLHTSETVTGFHDRLADTPECDDVLNDPCPDLENLMFPFAFPGSALSVTPKQRTVVQASALYRGAVEPGGGFAEPLDEGMMAAFAPPARPRVATGLSRGLAGIGRRLGPWRQAFTSDVARLLEAHWCQQGHGDPSAWLAAHTTPEALLALGRDPDAPGYVRQRALFHAALGYQRAGARLDGAALRALRAVAADRQAPRLARLGAVLGLRRVAPAGLEGLGLEQDADAAIAAATR
ncbi:MAG: hypothetical protein R3B72_02670 [Polyangiaceae bacterium]